MKKLILLAALLLNSIGLTATASAAESGPKTVREDRVWVYYGFNEQCSIYRYMEFGPEVIINGKGYHPFTVVKERRAYREFDNTGIHYGDIVDSEVNYPICYLREEDARIYELTCDGEGACLNSDIEPERYGEAEIYDWNMQDGDSWINNPFCGPGSYSLPSEFAQTYPEFNVQIKCEEPVTIDNEECRSFSLHQDGNGCLEDMKFIEGIGPVDCGNIGRINPMLCSCLFIDDSDRNPLVAVLSKSGELLYGSMPPAPSSEVAKTVREDRVWVYTGQKNGYRTYYFMEFGPEVMHGDKAYHDFIMTKSLTYTKHYPEIGEFVEATINSNLYSLREENGKIYKWEMTDYPDTYEEVEIYDWNLADGDEWEHNPFSFVQEYYIPLIIEACDPVMMEDVECKVLKLRELEDYYVFEEDLKFIEGVGPTRGTIAEVEPRKRSCDPSNTSMDKIWFHGLLTKSGELLYGSLPPTSGIDGVVSDADTDTRIYDLMGRELREAQPGTVYIQGGKKHVAR